MEHADFLATVPADAAALAAAARAAGPDVTVPATPEWTMAKLVKHAGTTHRWAARATGTLEFPDPAALDLALPGDPAEYPDWLEAGAAELVATLAAADPDAPCWSWGEDGHVRFWSRRMAHETSVHRWDAQTATGSPDPIEPRLAVDGIDERLENLPASMRFHPAGVDALAGDGETVHLHCTDTDGEWLLRFGPDGLACTREHAKGDVAVRGPASDLLLYLVGRRPLTRLDVFGDAAVLERREAILHF
jgi:uncharacterized protein (TIGR03083 family)